MWKSKFYGKLRDASDGVAMPVPRQLNNQHGSVDAGDMKYNYRRTTG